MGGDGGMNGLIGCEESGKVRDEMRARGIDATSCDILESRRPGPHIRGDLLSVLHDGWDFLIAFPPCTDLCVSGAKHFATKRADGRQQKSVAFFMAVANAPIPKIAIENPIGIMSTLWRKPDQIIQPWQFGHYETKATCLWLKGFPSLVPAFRTAEECREALGIEPGIKPAARIHRMAPSPDRARLRSETYDGIAQAMADQWGQG